MRTVFKYFSYIILFNIIFVLFFPKEQLFYKIVNTAYENKIYAKDYKLIDDLTQITINDCDIIYDGIKIVQIKKINAKLFFIYNNINIKNIEIDKSFNTFIPSTIYSINLKYNIFNPLSVKGIIKSKLYSIKIDFDILNMKINAIFKTSKFFRLKYKKIIKELKYDKNIKDYTYEYKL
jgi:hypothetical protein